MIHPACQWQSITPTKEKGILVGCDSNQEWLLQWWYDRYSAENAFPVTFADFGMSEKAKAWCACHGELIEVNIDTSFLKPVKSFSAIKKKKWRALYGSLENIRQSIFKKPFACLRSCYKHTIWIDLDCEILKGLDELFTTCTEASQLAIVREMNSSHYPRFDPNLFYNGGVIAFVHGCDIMAKWAQACILRNDEFCFDDNILSALISEQRLEVVELPMEYNWNFFWGINMYAIIVHWVTVHGKDYIKSHGGIKQDLLKLEQQLRNC